MVIYVSLHFFYKKSDDVMSIYLNSKPYEDWSIKSKPCIVKTKNKTIISKRYTLAVFIDYNSNIDFTIKEKSLDSNKKNKII